MSLFVLKQLYSLITIQVGNRYEFLEKQDEYDAGGSNWFYLGYIQVFYSHGLQF